MKKHPCNCQQGTPALPGAVPPVGAIREALGALAPSTVGGSSSTEPPTAPLAPPFLAPLAGSTLTLNELLELVRSNPGLKITLSFDNGVSPNT